MKIQSKLHASTMAACSALIALAVLTVPSARTADVDNALLARMAGTYLDQSVNATVTSGGGTNVTPVLIKLRMPKGKGRISGYLDAFGSKLPVTGRVRKVVTAKRRVQYVGELSLTVPGAVLSQRNFRAVAKAKGPNAEVLLGGIRLTGSAGGMSAVLSASFRGVK